MIPTVGFNMRKVTKGSVVIKLWDLGGQARYFCSQDLISQDLEVCGNATVEVLMQLSL
jgi:hypothetical protein